MKALQEAVTTARAFHWTDWHTRQARRLEEQFASRGLKATVEDAEDGVSLMVDRDNPGRSWKYLAAVFMNTVIPARVAEHDGDVFDVPGNVWPNASFGHGEVRGRNDDFDFDKVSREMLTRQEAQQ